MTACLMALAALGLAPARSNADVQILIEELNASGVVVASQSTALSGPGATPLFTGNYFTGFALVSTNSSSTPTAVASLTPSFNGQLTSAFDVTQDHKLRVTVTDNNFKPNGPNGFLTAEVSGSNGFATGTEMIVAETRLFDPVTNTNILVAPTYVSTDGTRVATDPNNPISVTGLTNPYAIEQVLTLSFSGDVPANATFGATGGVDLSSNPVPAPGGLVLALIGLPLIGLRRALRKAKVA